MKIIRLEPADGNLGGNLSADRRNQRFKNDELSMTRNRSLRVGAAAVAVPLVALGAARVTASWPFEPSGSVRIAPLCSDTCSLEQHQPPRLRSATSGGARPG